MSDRSVYDFMNYGLHEMPDLAGLDYESAVDAMPRLYGVSFGDGNDGVSQMYPRYYVRTCEPYVLAAAATLSQFTAGAGHAWAAYNMTVDGEADYTISATILDPPDDEMPDDSDSEERESWSQVNGAWLICEVFQDDEPRGDRMEYTSLSDCFTADLIDMARKV
jgi:hypothetical protein